MVHRQTEIKQIFLGFSFVAAPGGVRGGYALRVAEGLGKT
jgi:hypothetical protein